ncbi:hypothetical protein TeGR_g6282 [Tetraparma gracilis]|uniref:Peptidase M41 domain-containing protein n=1 Tax=Tetraparma gracilis TaxID=2962635 RepID=A0ABQ6N5X5_9STRA|nr:hypothetical protein TeGR_g6282 [Tetraparma gracilis]
MLQLTSLLLALSALCLPPCHTFAPSPPRALLARPATRLLMAEDVEALLAAARKLREESSELETKMGKTPAAAEVVTASSKALSMPEALALLEGADTSSRAALAALPLTSFDNPPKSTMGLKPFNVNLQGLESRTGGKVTGDNLNIDSSKDDVNLNDFKDATILVTLVSSVLAVGSSVALPNNTGATLTYLFAIVPVLWIAVGSSAPGILASIIAGAKATPESDEEKLSRVAAHEAAHFLCGYVCGLPVKSIQMSPAPQVEFFATPEGDLMRAEYSSDQINRLAVTALSGSVGEVLALGAASGGSEDLLFLQNCMSRSEEFLGSARQQDLTRWGALMAWNILKERSGAWNKLKERLLEGAREGGGGVTVAECCAIVEATPN